MFRMQALIIIIGAGLISITFRVLPLTILSRQEISSRAKKWMSFIPVSVFAALVGQETFFINRQFSLNIFVNPYLIPAAISLVVALKTKSIFWTLGIGLLAMALFYTLFY